MKDRMFLTNIDNKAQCYEIELYQYFPNVNDLLNISAEELGLNILLPKLNKYREQKAQQKTWPSMTSLLIKYHNPNLTQHEKRQYLEKINDLITSAHNILNLKGYIIPTQGNILESGIFDVTPLGINTAQSKNIDTYAVANNYCWEVLHPEIKEQAKESFRQGRYDDCVSNSFRKVEDCVRDKFTLEEKLYGSNLINQAFQSDVKIKNLFQSALEKYRNDNVAHACPKIDANYAFHQIMLASLLLKEIDKF